MPRDPQAPSGPQSECEPSNDINASAKPGLCCVDADCPTAAMPRLLRPRWWRRARCPPPTDDAECPPSAHQLEYVLAGSSPPAESAPNMYDSFEEPPPELAAHLAADALRQSAAEQMRAAAGRLRLLDDLEAGALPPNDLSPTERDVCLWWSAFLGRDDAVRALLTAGARPTHHDALGLTALHAACFADAVPCAELLLAAGAAPDYAPRGWAPLHCAAAGGAAATAQLLLDRGANVAAEGLLQCAVRADAPNMVRLLLAAGAAVNAGEAGGAAALHVAAELGAARCARELLSAPGVVVDARARAGDREATPLHLAADGGCAELVALLLAAGADATLRNHRGFTALHAAARAASLESVESLLRAGRADPNALDFDLRTPLHCAVGKADAACDVIETLVAWGADVNRQDEYGFTPLHLAALDGLSACVETLLHHGADVTTRSKKGNSALNVIARKTPASLAMITRKLDAAVSLHHSHSTNREVELELDFRSILQHCYPREISYLNTFVDEGQKEVLLHPLCSAFLYIKWEKIRKYYVARLFLSFIFVLCLTLYVLTALAHNCYNGSKDMEETIQEQELCQKQSILGDLLRKNPFVIEMQWWVLAGITIFEIFRKVYGIAGYSTVKQYLMQSENIIEWFVIVSVFLISYIYTNITYTWQNHVGAFAVLAGWTNLMMMIGQLPVFGTYVAMYQKVQKEFAKLLMAYSCILIGFTISFCVIFPDSSSFANPFMGFITVLTMMIGELNLDLLLNEPDGNDPPVLLEFSAQITYVLFLMFVTVVLMNLLVGIAVHDIQGLRKTAGLSKLVRQTKLISYMELALFNGYLPKCLLKILHSSALVSPQAYRVVLSVKPLNPSEKRLPRDIMMAAYDIAKMRKQYGHTISSSGSTGGAYSCFKKYENNNECGYREFGYGGGGRDPVLAALAARLDEAADGVRALNNDMRELRKLLQAQQLVLQRALNGAASPQPAALDATSPPPAPHDAAVT